MTTLIFKENHIKSLLVKILIDSLIKMIINQLIKVMITKYLHIASTDNTALPPLQGHAVLQLALWPLVKNAPLIYYVLAILAAFFFFRPL